MLGWAGQCLTPQPLHSIGKIFTALARFSGLRLLESPRWLLRQGRHTEAAQALGMASEDGHGLVLSVLRPVMLIECGLDNALEAMLDTQIMRAPPHDMTSGRWKVTDLDNRLASPTAPLVLSIATGVVLQAWVA